MADSQNPFEKSLFDFAIAVEQAIGTDETKELLDNITKFATDCPDILGELKTIVEENPKTFKSMLTRKGVEDLKGMIETVSASAPLFSSFF